MTCGPPCLPLLPPIMWRLAMLTCATARLLELLLRLTPRLACHSHILHSQAIVNCAPGCGLSNPLSSDPSVSYVELPVEEGSTDEFKSNPTYHWPAVMR